MCIHCCSLVETKKGTKIGNYTQFSKETLKNIQHIFTYFMQLAGKLDVIRITNPVYNSLHNRISNNFLHNLPYEITLI